MSQKNKTNIDKIDTSTRAWQSRITGHGEEAPDQLLANPKNWRIHPKAQQDALAGMLDRVGWVQDVIVNETTGHVVDGHLRVALAISREEPAVPVVYVNLTPEEEDLVLLTLDPLSAVAGQDTEKLNDLLNEVSADGALGDLLESLTGVSEVWKTTTEFDQAEKVSTPTAEEIEQREKELEEQALVRETKYEEALLDITCPECGSDFSINKRDVSR